jgi:hypothetical protein
MKNCKYFKQEPGVYQVWVDSVCIGVVKKFGIVWRFEPNPNLSHRIEPTRAAATERLFAIARAVGTIRGS